ncbi:MAG: DUF1801 domain-containing protein [Planctomycetota bacterium]|nr:DUF1801 domain-containing protein [Planctomycetota bacterium]
MQSKATTVAEYLDSLPPDRREALEAVRRTILENLDDQYEEGMQYGMIGYYVPHSVFPDGYHCDPRQPLPFAGLASQKNHMSVYLMSMYGSPGGEAAFRRDWEATGRKLDMGKCCIRFKRLEQVALDVLGKSIREMPAHRWIEHYTREIRSKNKASAAKASASHTGKAAAKTATKVSGKAVRKTSKRTGSAASKKAPRRAGVSRGSSRGAGAGGAARKASKKKSRA